MPTARLTILGVLCVAAVTLVGQDSRSAGDRAADAPQQPAFVTGAQYVRVDLYVTRHGRLVDDLRPGEIALFEDGVRQTIDTFERIVFRPPDPFDPPVEPRTLEASRLLAADPRSRVIVVFLDTPHMRPARPDYGSTLLRTIGSALGPDDLVAAMTPAMRPSDLTFSRVLTGLPGHGGLDETEMLYQLCYPRTPRGSPAAEMILRRRERMTFDALESLVAYLGQLREERKTVLLVTDGWAVYTPTVLAPRGGETPALPHPPTPPFPNPPLPPFGIPPIPPFGGPAGVDRVLIVTPRGVWAASGADRAKCDAERAALANLNHRGRLVEIIGLANRNNVSFSPVSPEGLRVSGLLPFGAGMRENPPYENWTRLEVQSTLRDLAEQTGGHAIVNTNNLSGGMARMIGDSSAYYLIGYQSTNAVLDGRYRRITVKVQRPGVSVRARPGYHAGPVAPRETALDLAPLAIDPLAIDPVAGALARIAEASHRSPLHLRDAVWAAPAAAGAGGVWIAGEIDPASRREAGWTQGATAEIAAHAAGGDEVFAARIDVTAQHPAFAVRVPSAGTLPPGDYTVRVRMAGSDPLARVSETVRITVPAEPVALGHAVLWRAGPFTGPQPVPTADPRFRRQERLRLELPTMNDEPVTARLLDRNGSLLPVPVAVSERRDAAEGFRWVVVDVVLAPLALGEYVVEATQGHASRVTAFRIVR